MSREEKLLVIRKNILANCECVLKANANFVFGEGNLFPKVLIIGEGPGAEEDLQKRPFVGQSGQILRKALKASNIKDFYILNTVFWRPPNNRPPSFNEIEACLPFIKEIILLLKPKVIFLLGNVALKTFLKESNSITRVRGRLYNIVLEKEEVKVVATYHPAYLLRNPLKSKEFWKDILFIYNFIQ